MEVKNLATFGLFLNGTFITTSNIDLLMIDAQNLAERNPGARYNISQMVFNDKDKEDTTITEGTVVLGYYNHDDAIYITN